MDDDRVDVCIVGAGYAGLTAARRLTASGATVEVLEARERVGGRVFTDHLADGTPLDLGGQWVGPTQDRILALAREVGAETFPTWDVGDHVIESGGRRRTYSGTIPRVNWAGLAGVGIALARLDRMARSVPLEAPWSARRAQDWDSVTLQTWMRRNVPTRVARDLLALGVGAVFACDPRDISLLHFLFYVHSGGGLDRLLSTRGGAQQDRIVGGAQVVAERVAEKLGTKVHLGAAVRSVRARDDHVEVVSDALTVRARRVVVTVPPALIPTIQFMPDLPSDRAQLVQRMPHGSVIKCLAVYGNPFWRAAGRSGQATSLDGPVKLTFDASPPSALPGILLAFVDGDDARALGQRPVSERRDAVLADLARYFGPAALLPLEYVDKDWSADPWTRGCYAAYLGTGVTTSYASALRMPHGKVHWAGTETSPVWNGYIDGAVRSGERVAAEVLAVL